MRCIDHNHVVPSRSLDVDPRSPCDRMLLGNRPPISTAGIGFGTSRVSYTDTTADVPPLTYNGDAHLMTVAPTRSGKGRSVIIPNLLNTTQPVIVIDPKGENYQVTADYRRQMGHRVVVIDPFSLVTRPGKSDSLNPFDLYDLPGVDVESESQMLAHLFSEQNRGVKDPFWDENGCGLLSAVLAAVRATKQADERTMDAVFQLVMANDVIYGLAVLLDTVGKSLPNMAYREIASFLQLSERDTRPGVLATAQSYLKSMLSAPVLHTLKPSSFALSDIANGKPTDVFLVLPPDKLRSHRGLLKIWIGTLLRAITSRRVIPDRRTLLLIDEAGQLGEFLFLESILTLCAGYGLQCWTFWQNVAQLKANYGERFATILDNCDVLQTFGMRNGRQVAELAELFNVAESELWDLGPNEQFLRTPDHPQGIVAERCDYLTDEMFAGRYSENRFYSQRPAQLKKQDEGPGAEQPNGLVFRTAKERRSFRH